MSTSEVADFAPRLLLSLRELLPQGTSHSDLALELGLSAQMRSSDLDPEAALDELLAVRRAVIEAGGFDPNTEPIPFTGRSPRLDVLNLTIYLGELVARASANTNSSEAIVVDRAIACLADHVPVRRRHPRVMIFERRSS